MRRVGNVEGTSVIVAEQKSLEKIKQMVLGGAGLKVGPKAKTTKWPKEMKLLC
jgi:hypothetical protein